MNTAPHLTTCLCVDADRKVKSNRFSISRKFSQKGSGDILRKRILPSNGNNPVVAVPGNAPRSIRGGVSWKAQFVAISSTRLAWDLQSGGLQSGSLRSPAKFAPEAAECRPCAAECKLWEQTLIFLVCPRSGRTYFLADAR